MANNRVPNQRHITISKSPTDKKNIYTTNNLCAIDEAASRLQSKAGFKLYMYLAKNQDKHSFNLYSSDFVVWAGVGIRAYNSAFDELVEEGYLILKEGTKTIYTFYDKSQIQKEEDDDITIQIPKEKVEEVRKILQGFEF
jgi:exo-beta-1,3-glucanase (GH17 family)